MRRNAALALLGTAALLAGCPTLELEPRPYRCDRADGGEASCPFGLRCGLEGYCYDVQSAGPVACEPGQPDCAPGWTCGLAQRCHPEQPGAWACTGDEHCFGWRCGLDGVCLDASGEALAFDRFGDAGTPRLLSPRMTRGGPDELSTSGFDLAPLGGKWWSAWAVSMAEPAGPSAQRLTHLQYRVQVGDGGVEQSGTDLATAQRPGRVEALASDYRGLFVLSGGAVQLWRRDGGTLVPTEAWDVPGATAVRAAPSAGEPRAFAFSDQGAWALTSKGFLALDGAPTGAITDLEPFPMADGGGVVLANPMSFAMKESGIYFGHSPGGAPPYQWTAAASNGALMGQGAQVAGIELRGQPPEYLAVRVVEVLNTFVDAIPRSKLFLLGRCPRGAPGCAEVFPDRVLLGPCTDPCEALNQRLVSFAPSQTESGPSLEVLCGRPAGGGGALFTLVGGENACAAIQDYGASSKTQDRVIASRTVSGLAAWAGAHGQLWLGTTVAGAKPLVLDRTPVGLLRDASLDGGSQTTELAITVSGAAVPDPALGAVLLEGEGSEHLRATAVVPGTSWVVHRGAFVSDAFSSPPRENKVVAYVGPSVPVFSDPVTAVLLPTREGGTQLLVSAFDQLISGDVAAWRSSPDAGSVELELRVVPDPRRPIISLAALRNVGFPDGGTALAGGYAATQDRVFHFYAETEHRWRAQELRLPDGELVSVWVDGEDRGRAGYSDGKVVSLPNGLQLVGPISSSAAVDFEDVCGEPWLLAADGLYRVSREPGAHSGEWKRVLEPEAPVEGYRPGRFAGGKLERSARGLAVFTAWGGWLELPIRCPGGEP